MAARIGWCVLLSAVVVGRVTAQTVPGQGPDLRMLSLRSLKAGRSIRVGGQGFGTLTGSFAGLRDGSLWLDAEATARSVPVGGIDSVWVSHGHAATGAVVGGLLGVALGAAAISGKKCDFLDNGCMTEGYATFIGVWLGTTLVGAIIGGETKSWDLRYPFRVAQPTGSER